MDGYLEDHPCVRCGYTGVARTFHHNFPHEKQHDVSRMIGKGYTPAAIQREIDKCMVLCANCHMELEHDIRKNLQAPKD